MRKFGSFRSRINASRTGKLAKQTTILGRQFITLEEKIAEIKNKIGSPFTKNRQKFDLSPQVKREFADHLAQSGKHIIENDKRIKDTFGISEFGLSETSDLSKKESTSAEKGSIRGSVYFTQSTKFPSGKSGGTTIKPRQKKIAHRYNPSLGLPSFTSLEKIMENIGKKTRENIGKSNFFPTEHQADEFDQDRPKTERLQNKTTGNSPQKISSKETHGIKTMIHKLNLKEIPKVAPGAPDRGTITSSCRNRQKQIFNIATFFKGPQSTQSKATSPKGKEKKRASLAVPPGTYISLSGETKKSFKGSKLIFDQTMIHGEEKKSHFHKLSAPPKKSSLESVQDCSFLESLQMNMNPSIGGSLIHASIPNLSKKTVSEIGEGVTILCLFEHPKDLADDCNLISYKGGALFHPS